MLSRFSILQIIYWLSQKIWQINKSFWLSLQKPNSDEAKEVRWRLRNLRTLHQKYGKLLGIEVKAWCNWEKGVEGKTATKHRRLRSNNREKPGKGFSNGAHLFPQHYPKMSLPISKPEPTEWGRQHQDSTGVQLELE